MVDELKIEVIGENVGEGSMEEVGFDRMDEICEAVVNVFSETLDILEHKIMLVDEANGVVESSLSVIEGEGDFELARLEVKKLSCPAEVVGFERA